MNCEHALELHELYVDVGAGREPRSALEPDSYEALEAHFTSCSSCRESLDGLVAATRTIAALPYLRAPRVRGGSTSTRALAWSTAAAALLGVGSSLVALRLRDERILPAPVAGVGWLEDRGNAESASAERQLSGTQLRSGRVARVADRPVSFAWSRDVTVRLEPDSVFRVDDDRLELLAGSLGASVREGAPFELATPVASVRVRGTVFHVRVTSAREAQPRAQREDPMSSPLKVVPVAAAVSVFVSLGTVMVYNQFGETEIGADQMARVLEDSAPEVVRLPETVATLRKDIEAMNAELARASEGLREVRRSVAEQGKTIEEGLASVEASAGGDPADPTPPDASLEEKMAKVEETFQKLTSAGFTVLQSPRLGKLVETLRELGDEGTEFVLDQLAAEDSGARFLAAAVIENLRDPKYVDALEASALGDDSFLVRRMSSHALAFLGDEAAGDSLARVVEGEKKDTGVRLNAWFGLARLGRPEAVSSFDRLLNEASGDVTADLVVDTALKVSSPAMLPALRKAYDNEAVSVATRSRIVRTLAEAEGDEYLRFVRDLAADESADEILREAARDSLER